MCLARVWVRGEDGFMRPLRHGAVYRCYREEHLTGYLHLPLHHLMQTSTRGRRPTQSAGSEQLSSSPGIRAWARRLLYHGHAVFSTMGMPSMRLGPGSCRASELGRRLFHDLLENCGKQRASHGVPQLDRSPQGEHGANELVDHLVVVGVEAGAGLGLGLGVRGEGGGGGGGVRVRD